jgi:hypothetical protein
MKIVNNIMWFWKRSKISKLEEKVLKLEKELELRHEESAQLHASINLLCKEIKDFLVEENKSTENDVQREEAFVKVTRSN